MIPPDRVCELFCGAGGMALGFASRFDIVQAVDINEFAVRTYQTNHPDTQVRRQDIRNLSGCRGDFEGITGVIGGPPCQQWSRRNIRKTGDDIRAELPGEFLRLVEEIKPRFFVLENVPFAPKEKKQKVIDAGRLAGYDVVSLHLNAADFGAAQTRRRWIVVGLKGKRWTRPSPRPPGTVRSAFSGISENWGGMQSTPETLQHLTNARTREWCSMTGSSGYKNMIHLEWDRPAPAVVNLKKVYMVHPDENRNISLAEAAALQGFPADYIWKGTESSIAQMIANAMPAELAGAIAGSIMSGGTIQERIT